MARTELLVADFARILHKKSDASREKSHTLYYTLKCRTRKYIVFIITTRSRRPLALLRIYLRDLLSGNSILFRPANFLSTRIDPPDVVNRFRIILSVKTSRSSSHSYFVYYDYVLALYSRPNITQTARITRGPPNFLGNSPVLWAVRASI